MTTQADAQITVEVASLPTADGLQPFYIYEAVVPLAPKLGAIFGEPAIRVKGQVDVASGHFEIPIYAWVKLIPEVVEHGDERSIRRAVSSNLHLIIDDLRTLHNAWVEGCTQILLHHRDRVSTDVNQENNQ